MSYFLPFILTFGGVLALSAIVAATIVRTASVPVAWKMILPAAILALGLYAPFAVDAMLGRPVATTMASLPDKAILVAYVPHDEAGTVDLWLMDGGRVPRAYEIALDPQTRKALREAAGELSQSHGVPLRKARKDHGKAKPGGSPAVTDIRDGFDPGYEIDRNALAQLPPKG